MTASGRGEIEQLWEMKDAWGFCGTLWLAKDHPAFNDGPMREPTGQITQLTSHNRFERTKFHLDTGATGWAVWFIRGPRDATSTSLHNRSLNGWVPLEREAELGGWIDFLNDLITKHVEKVRATWAAMTEEQQRDAISAPEFTPELS